MRNAYGQRPSAVEVTDNYTAYYFYDGPGSNMQYVCKGIIGSSLSDNVWQIKKLSYNAQGNITSITWAEGNSSFDKVCNDRASYNYS
jgi:YD repeat-containing protein